VAAGQLPRAGPTPGPAALGGLTADQVRARQRAGRTNSVAATTSRSVTDIVRANVFTRFNAILGSLLAVILVVGPIQDALFGLVLVSNTLIGIVQEVRAKRTLDHLALVVASRATVVRDGAPVEVAREAIVLDDLVRLGPGDEVLVDAVVVEAVGFEVDEALLSGESEPVAKAVGDEVLSGSYVAAGSAHVRATRVGEDAYAARFGREARGFDLVRSELRAGIDRILRGLTYVLVPAAALLITSQLVANKSLPEAIRSSVGGVGSMIPEGLVLLTSVAFAVGIVRLGRQRVLVNELAAIEGLARVDVLCLDKTGTLTDGNLTVTAIDPVGHPDGDVHAAIGALAAADPRPNASLRALAAACPPPGWAVTTWVPFSSATKWSAVDAGPHGVWLLGAPDVVLAAATDVASSRVLARVEARAAAGRRLMLLASSASLDGDTLPASPRPVALVELEERLRPDAARTVAWFADEGVALRVLSGDHPETVAAVAERAGIDRAGEPVDARHLPDDPAGMTDAMARATVFGRVAPAQKRAMVGALQRGGHVVAMTGDGVNDVLALKAADLGIAMGAGSPATRAVGRVVLLDNAFERLPAVVAEGRRVIANIERVANLFLTKTVYATLLAVAVGVARLPYPFYPRHLTIVSSLTIGIPGFFLALAPNTTRAHHGFVGRVLRFAVPAGTVAAASTFAGYALARAEPGVSLREARTTATVVLFLVALWVLGILARPYTGHRGLLVGSMAGAFAAVLAVPALRDFFALDLPAAVVLLAGIGVASVGCAALELGWRVTGWVEGWRGARAAARRRDTGRADRSPGPA
jgi:cation-transporting ATPase E